MDYLRILVSRTPKIKGFTPGKVYINGDLFCYSLEDEVREVEGQPVESWKIAGQTAIPRGKYKVIMSHSNHFNRELPELLNVPGYTGVRIHSGNQADSTSGCVLVGQLPADNGWLGTSKPAEARIIERIKQAIESGQEVWITLI